MAAWSRPALNRSVAVMGVWPERRTARPGAGPRGRAARADGSARAGRTLDLLVGLDVPAERRLAAAGPLLGLLLVGDLDLGEVQGDVLGQPVLAAGPAGADRGDQ